MCSQVHVDTVQLRLAPGVDSYRDRQILPPAAETFLYRCILHIRHMFPDQSYYQGIKIFFGAAHGLDGKPAGKFYQGLVIHRGYTIYNGYAKRVTYSP